MSLSQIPQIAYNDKWAHALSYYSSDSTENFFESFVLYMLENTESKKRIHPLTLDWLIKYDKR
jgi:hypothetical protein